MKTDTLTICAAQTGRSGLIPVSQIHPAHYSRPARTGRLLHFLRGTRRVYRGEPHKLFQAGATPAPATNLPRCAARRRAWPTPPATLPSHRGFAFSTPNRSEWIRFVDSERFGVISVNTPQNRGIRMCQVQKAPDGAAEGRSFCHGGLACAGGVSNHILLETRGINPGQAAPKKAVEKT